MKNLVLLLSAFALIGCATSAKSLSLNSSIIPKGRQTVMTEQQRNGNKEARKIFYANTTKEERSKIGILRSFGNINGKANWYYLYSSLNLYVVNTDTNAFLGSLPFKDRWQHEFTFPSFTERLSTLEDDEYNYLSLMRISELNHDYMINGCLMQSPMRYGDLSDDSKQEIVLFLDQDIIVFSPELQKVIFQLRWIEERYSVHYEDEANERLLEITPEVIQATIATAPNAPQYYDPFIDAETPSGYLPGIKSYKKFFVGNFDGDTNTDIIVWHKNYTSNKFADFETNKGFSLSDQKYSHYELIDSPTNGVDPTGEYLPQNTTETTVQQWLASANLTWQKGYPNTTECEGQTGHIPEMIDPLLNDPDVLQ